MNYPSEAAADLKQYAADLGLPPDWYKRVKSGDIPGAMGSELVFTYEGKPLATYRLDSLRHIDGVTHHIPLPPKPDPLVIATEHELMQPTDETIRRFKNLVFRPSEVAYLNNVDKAGMENSESFEIAFRNGKTLVCGNQKNYANSGMSTFEWFLEHVMCLTPTHRKLP